MIVCSLCGLINAENFTQNPFDQFNDGKNMDVSLVRYKPSKKYDRSVHFNQMLAHGVGNDPSIKKKYRELIIDYLNKNPDIVGPMPWYVGPKAIKTAIKKLGLNPTYAARWVQIRRSFIVEDDIARFPEPTLDIIKLRFQCVSKAFDETLRFNRSSVTTRSVSRANMLNLSYVILQLSRLESFELFKSIARFFPQSEGKQQPSLNNLRWSILMDFCSKNFNVVEDPKIQDTMKLTWSYTPLTEKDILDYCSVLR